MTEGLGQLPNLFSFVAVIVALNALALGAMVLSRRWARRHQITQASPVIGAWATATGSLCALLFTFAIVNLWNAARTTDANVDSEAAAIRMVARDIRSDQLPLVRAYVMDSIAEWPSLCKGTRSDASATALDKLERNAKGRERSYDDDLRAQLSVLEDLHYDRLRSSQASVPRELWVALWVLAGAVLIVLALAFVEPLELHVALMVAIGSGLGVLFWVTTLFDHPFCGPTGVDAGALLQTLRVLGA